MEGVDNGRTGWMKDEKVFNTTNVKDMKLLWKVKLDSTPREMHNLFSPLIVEKATMPQGTREMAVVAGVSDDLWGIDTVSGETMWHRKFDSTYTPPAGGRGGAWSSLAMGHMRRWAWRGGVRSPADAAGHRTHQSDCR